MATRITLPGEFFMEAGMIDQRIQLRRWLAAGDAQNGNWARPQAPPPELVDRIEHSTPQIALRWVLNPVLGIPLEPFTVWTRSAALREPATPINGWQGMFAGLFVWDGVTEMLRIELDIIDGPLTATGYSAKRDVVAVASAVAGTTLVLEGGPMLSVRVAGTGSVKASRGLSLLTLANGNGWQPIEIVGLPYDPAAMGGAYYQPNQQGPVASLGDPRDAAVGRLKKWGPRLGWMTLAGLPAWRPPDPTALIDDMQADLLSSLLQVLQSVPPPDVDRQVTTEIKFQLSKIRQVWSGEYALNGGANSQPSSARVRPLQALTTAVASDVWASLALGYGTGYPVGDIQEALRTDFMVTAPWTGMMRIRKETSSPWPWTPHEIVEDSVPVNRELAAVVLSTKPRSAPGTPTPVNAQQSYFEGAPKTDAPYHTAAVVLTDRPGVVPELPRVSAYSLARYDKPGAGRYAMRQHARAKGWIPIATAKPIPDPEQKNDPALPDGKAVLRDSGVEMPLKGAAELHQYAIAATDLFGQWSAWAPAWLSIGPADVLTPAVASVAAKPFPGPGNADPCSLTVTAEVVWDWRERSALSLRIAVHIYDPPPGVIPEPVASAGLTPIAIVSFDAAGAPSSPTPGVVGAAISDDGKQVYPGAHPPFTDLRRFRITLAGLPIVYGPTIEKAVAVFVKGEERIRPGELSKSWSGSHEAVIAPNPIPPVTPPPLPAVYPFWASLPDPAGVSRATVKWTPSGAPKYRVYEATEAGVLGVMGQPAPNLVTGYADRMQALFNLYKNPANWAKLKSVYRKVDNDPVLPPLELDGTMRHEVVLPRGSSLIHCFIVVGLTPANLVSSWPEPDGNGRNGFLPYAIPHRLQPVQPKLTAVIDGGGVPQVAVRVEGSVPAKVIRLYRARTVSLAREVGTMDLVASVATNPAAWHETTIADAGATPSWKGRQYRAVALTDDDPDHAGMAVPSMASKAYALLVPPMPPAVPVLTPNVLGTTDTVSIVRVDTPAPRETTDIGDHTIALLAATGAGAPRRFTGGLASIAVYPSVAAVVTSGETIAYVKEAGGLVLYLRLTRAPGEEIALTLDLTDPLGRSAHAVLTVPFAVPEPTPVIGAFSLALAGGVLRGAFTINTPVPSDPARAWTLTMRMARAIPPLGPLQTRTFDVSAIPVIANAAEMPKPELRLQPFAIAQIQATDPRQILFWLKTVVPLRVQLTLTNAEGQTATANRVSL